ncbi:FMN-dependent NADH-azoreductase [Hymenobacter terricola]|uniref:FMN-dependent NADH-azoreductase n=1 Tax=Hymenobacter terricola TaxID=2819236 RepID=UPI001B308A6E|nr:NAD(P)H-dependent oxidoreductase [Hymenobacter terricola]
MSQTLLRIDASARLAGSHSRGLADDFQASWQQAHPDGRVMVRDLAQTPIAQIDALTIEGFYTAPDQHTPQHTQATALSDELIAELLAADVLLLSTPVYNFAIPAAFKAYIDQVARIGRTFSADETGLHGLVPDRPTYVAVAAGLVYHDSPFTGFNFVAPYLEELLGFLGITSVEFLTVEGTSVDPAALERTTAAAHQRIAEVTAA